MASIWVSMRHHLPVASSTRSTTPRRSALRTAGGAHQRKPMSRSFVYVHSPEKTATMSESGYEPAFHMSRTEPTRVKSKTGGVRTRSPPTVSSTCTVAPACVFAKTKRPMLTSRQALKR